MTDFETRLQKQMQKVRDGVRTKKEVDYNGELGSKIENGLIQIENKNIGFRIRVFFEEDGEVIDPDADDKKEFYGAKTLENYDEELHNVLADMARDVFGEDSSFKRVSGLKMFTDTYHD